LISNNLGRTLGMSDQNSTALPRKSTKMLDKLGQFS
jgi:hypothetical protein